MSIRIRIPQFRDTHDALAFGKLHRGNIHVIEALKELREITLKDYDAIEKGKGKSDRLFQLAFRSQFLREATEVAEGKEYLEKYMDKK